VTAPRHAKTLCEKKGFSTPIANLAGGALVLAALVLVASLLGPASPARAAEACPNEAFRTGYSAALPDCRAYELVSPPGIQPYWETFGDVKRNEAWGVAAVGTELGATAAQSSAHGGLAFYSTFAPPGSTTDGPYYLASRGQGGWSTQNVIPPVSTEIAPLCLPYMVAWSPNLERGILAIGENRLSTRCGLDEPELTPGEPRGAQNLFVRDSSTGSYQIIDQTPLGGESPANAFYMASSSDLNLVAFTEAARLTSDAPPLNPAGPAEGRDYYVWTAGGADHLLTVLPDGSPTEGMIVDAAVPSGAGEPGLAVHLGSSLHTVALDGSRVFFTSGGNLYARENPAAEQSAFDGAGECDEPTKACTVEIDLSETAEPGGGGAVPIDQANRGREVIFTSAGKSGEVVFFADRNRLTPDSTATSAEPDLYEYDFRRTQGQRLTDLTVPLAGGEHGDLQGLVAVNETGAAANYVYFAADGVLASNANRSGATAIPGQPNLYVRHNGGTTFIATFAPGPVGSANTCVWESRAMCARVSRDGRYLGFDSLERLTGFDNDDPQTGEPWQEVFLYDAQAEELSCASCGGTGAAPTAPASIKLPVGVQILEPTPMRLQQNVSDQGQVFFDTQNQLEGARNGQSNVYEYREGRLALLSSGTAESPSYFYEASADGDDVYLLSGQALEPGGDSAELSIYDARVGGGFPSLARSVEPCAGEGCRAASPPSPAAPATPGSALLNGGGNLTVHPANSNSKARKLSKALKACRGDRHQKARVRCEKSARRRYGRAK
jgi:hypothetical protein